MSAITDTVHTPSFAAPAGPFIRRLFDALPATSQEMHVPDELRDFVSSYMGERGWTVSYITGQLTKKAYVRLEAKP